METKRTTHATFQAHVINPHQFTKRKAKKKGSTSSNSKPRSQYFPIIVKQIFTSEELCKLFTKRVKSDRSVFEVKLSEVSKRSPQMLFGAVCATAKKDNLTENFDLKKMFPELHNYVEIFLKGPHLTDVTKVSV